MNAQQAQAILLTHATTIKASLSASEAAYDAARKQVDALALRRWDLRAKVRDIEETRSLLDPEFYGDRIPRPTEIYAEQVKIAQVFDMEQEQIEALARPFVAQRIHDRIMAGEEVTRNVERSDWHRAHVDVAVRLLDENPAILQQFMKIV